MNPRQELVALLRGRFAVPILSHLGEAGLLARMAGGSFHAASFPEIADRAVLTALFRYLEALGLLERDEGADAFQATELGRLVFAREGAFHLLESYRGYFDELPALLSGEAAPTVERWRNVLGSGSLHARKFFPAGLEMLRGNAWSTIADIGCGNGAFLASVLQEHPTAVPVLVDISDAALQEATERLAGSGFRAVLADGNAVEDWAPAVPAGGRRLVSLWFVLHEFAGGEPARAAEFFRRVARALPDADILLGEIVAVPPALLAAERHASLLPELQLGHELSGQGVLTWNQHQQVLAEIPYRLVAERHFDLLAPRSANPQPSAFLWRLVRKGGRDD